MAGRAARASIPQKTSLMMTALAASRDKLGNRAKTGPISFSESYIGRPAPKP